MNLNSSWIADSVGALVNPDAQFFPFSFSTDGQPSAPLLPQWGCTRTKEPAGDGKEPAKITLRDVSSGLVVTCPTIRYTDFPAIEWTLHFSHTGSQPSPLISDIRGLDVTLPVPHAQTKPVVRAARGGVCTPEDYEPLQFEITEGKSILLQAGGGRSSNGHLPFFNVDMGRHGMLIAVGWSGQWSADISMGDASGIRVRADIAETHLRLRPGESIRTARILAVFWEGNPLQGHHLLRRLIYRHCTPLLAGQKPLPPVQCNSWFPVGDSGGKATATNQVELLQAYRSLGIEYLVMDAGWYGDSADWSANVGTWRPRKDAFPRGLYPVGEAARETGIGFGLWFEPERVQRKTELDLSHPEWLLELDGPSTSQKLLNLGLPDVQDWFIELVSGYVRDVPLCYFRHDFNMNPLPYWKKADAPDRIGVTEIRYVEGLYRIWDELHARYPALMIEGCASGGRRMDLESISRCHTYWKSDLYGFNHANQGHVYGASLYLPGNYLNTPLFNPGGEGYLAPHYLQRNSLDGMLKPEDPYPFRSVLGGALCLGWDPRLPGFNRDLALQWIKQFKRLRHLTVGDFYPLTPYSLRATDWIAYQFHREDMGEGMAVFFRREHSIYTSADVALQGILNDCDYEVCFEDTAEKKRVPGRELARAMHITINGKPGSALIVYRQVGKSA